MGFLPSHYLVDNKDTEQTKWLHNILRATKVSNVIAVSSGTANSLKKKKTNQHTFLSLREILYLRRSQVSNDSHLMESC